MHDRIPHGGEFFLVDGTKLIGMGAQIRLQIAALIDGIDPLPFGGFPGICQIEIHIAVAFRGNGLLVPEDDTLVGMFFDQRAFIHLIEIDVRLPFRFYEQNNKVS